MFKPSFNPDLGLAESRSSSGGDFAAAVSPVHDTQAPDIHCGAAANTGEAMVVSAIQPHVLPEPPLRILLVDDSPDSRLLISAYLKNTRTIVVEAADGREAVERFIAWRFDLVLMDLKMPVMNGYEACERIRAWEREYHFPPAPIIAVSACVFDEDIQQAQQAGFDMHIAKPIRKSAFLEAIYVAQRCGATRRRAIEYPMKLMEVSGK